MTWITRSRRGRPRGLRAGLVSLILPGVLIVGCGGSDDGGARTPTPTRPPATATATSPPATSTVPAVTATATAPGATPTPTSMRTATASATPTTGNASARAACDKLVACRQCFADSNGACLGTDACAARLSADAAICLNGVSGCDQTALGNCLFLGCDGSDPSGDCQ